MVYQDRESKKYGYLDDNGHIAIPAAFYSASVFQEGYAIVRTGEDYFGNNAGVTNTKGEFVVKPEYIDLYYAGNGLFAASNTFIPSSYQARKAVVGKDGKQLTDYKYYEINVDKIGLIFINDGEAAYFVNDRFEAVENLPRIPGSGIMTVMGDVIKAVMFNR